MLWPNGQKYDGEWQKGLMHGMGVHRWPNGTCREGIWERNVRTKWTSQETFGMQGMTQRKKAAQAKAREKEKAAAAAEAAKGSPTRPGSTRPSSRARS